MREEFVSKNVAVPQTKEFGDYYLVPITTNVTDEDLAVLLANADAITEQRGGGSSGTWDGWPYNYTREENFKDLAWLELCAKERQLFSYIIRRKKDNLYIGCLYIYPIELHYEKIAKDFDVDFSFWIIQSEFDKGKYDYIFKEILEWLSSEWPFKKERIYLRNKIIPKNLK
jgi:hypothetical protein